MDFKKKFSDFLGLLKEMGLASQSFDDALLLGQLYGKILYANHSGIYRDDDFENVLVSWYLERKSAPVDDAELFDELHIISEPLSTGGHTRLLERLIQIRGSGDVLVTRAVADLEGRLRVEPSTKIYKSPTGFALDELVATVSAYQTIFLHIHPDDLLASVAVGVVKKLVRNRVILVNHADHVFSFGYSYADTIAEVSEYGFYLSQSRRAACSSYLGIPVAITDMRPCSEPKSDKISIFSAGSAVKYKPHGDASFPDTVGKIFSAVPLSTITVIGPCLLSNWWWWRAKVRNPRRLKIHKALPYDRYISLIESADIYIDSFPMTGGTALPEVRSRGIPVTGLLSSSSGYTPLDATKFGDITELVNELKRYSLSEGVILDRNNSQEILSLTRSAHHESEIRIRLDKMLSGNNVIPPGGIKTFDVEFYERAWVERASINLGQDFFDLIGGSNLSKKIKLKVLLCALRLSSAHKVPIYIGRLLQSRFS